MSQVNEVRQVLMNELGLTREAIRAEINEVIEKTAEKYFKKLLEEGIFLKVLESVIDKELKRDREKQCGIVGLADYIRKTIAQKIVERLEFKLKD